MRTPVVIGARFRVRAEPFGVARGPARRAPHRARRRGGSRRDRGDGGARPLRRRQRDRPEPTGAAGCGPRQLGRGDDQLRPGPRRRPRQRRDRRPTRPTGITATAAINCGAATRTASLVHEISGLVAGRALDVGAGEGGDAVWLAEQGWEVTANDISRRALDRVSAEAERRGLPIECDHADANALDPFASGGIRPRVGALCVDPAYARRPRCPQPAERRRTWRHASRGEPRPRSDARGHRYAPTQPAVRPRCLPSRRRLRRCARRRARTGTSRSTSRALARLVPRRATTSTTSCCAPDGAPTEGRTRQCEQQLCGGAHGDRRTHRAWCDDRPRTRWRWRGAGGFAAEQTSAQSTARSALTIPSP